MKTYYLVWMEFGKLRWEPYNAILFAYYRIFTSFTWLRYKKLVNNIITTFFDIYMYITFLAFLTGITNKSLGSSTRECTTYNLFEPYIWVLFVISKIIATPLNCWKSSYVLLKPWEELMNLKIEWILVRSFDRYEQTSNFVLGSIEVRFVSILVCVNVFYVYIE